MPGFCVQMYVIVSSVDCVHVEIYDSARYKIKMLYLCLNKAFICSAAGGKTVEGVEDISHHSLESI